MDRKFWFLRGLRIILAVAFFVALAGFVVMSLWNWLMPYLFHLPTVSFAQALGLFILSKLLLGGFRGGPGAAWKAKAQQHWRQKMASRMQGMSEEEREKFRQRMRNCGPWGRMAEARQAAPPTATAD
ncbi:DUF3106 domain-containing protein [Hymenobacter sp. 15J16-1T3B]|uniref:DUF3106 domain-containing protein n=1 Tax=Hymenobacter sp. 15J16-1T3B TaxID=2886941 RepID=UPI001D107D73|nr:DUF3106 domain-containing protein [Hymenobacter sp. 15J16-1T3B]MCC3157951.1 DUF3106 domain-containing protein [Hymenobacter sp. 15J16-1T3B]